jgi:hypothetical protein
MHHNWFITSAFSLIYLVGFLVPIFARGWTGLAIRFLVCLGVTVGLICWVSRGGGLVILAFSFPITLFAAGAASGLGTRAALLGLRWDAITGKGLLATLIGLLVLPAGQLAYGSYRQEESRAVYAALPRAHALPMIPACDPFRETGPMIETVMTVRPSDPRTQTVPAQDIPILYPAAYREPFPPAFPQHDERSPWVNFEMYISDAQPAPPKDDKDVDGKTISLDKRRPSIRFHFLSRPPIAAHGVRMLNITSGRSGVLDEMPDIHLTASSYLGLSLVVAPQPGPINRRTKSFVAMREGTIEELVQCSGKGTFPHCSFALDESGIPIEGTFPETSLVDWALIRNDLRSFVSCSVTAARQGAS